MNPIWLKWALRGAIALVVIGALLFVIDYWRHRGDAEKTAVLNERLRVLASERDSLKKTAAMHDTIVRTKAVTQYRTLRDSVLVRLTDTVLVKETIARADTVIAKDSTALKGAEQRIAIRDAQIANERRTRATADSLHRVQLAKANPRIRPFISLGVDPFDTNVRIARAGLDVRVYGPISLTGDVAYHSLAHHHRAGFVGLKVTF